MRVTSTLMLAALACLSLFGEGYAQGVHAVRPIPGFVCMSLSPEDEAATQQSARSLHGEVNRLFRRFHIVQRT